MSSTVKHGHGHDDGAVHSHVSSSFFYVAIFAALLCLTVLTVGQSYVDLGSLNIVLVILIASTKASLVVAFFMHLRWDNKFNALIFVASLLFIGVFFAYTMNDTDKRGDHDPDQNVKISPRTGEPAPGGFVKPTDEHLGPAGADPGAAGHGATPGHGAESAPSAPAHH